MEEDVLTKNKIDFKPEDVFHTTFKYLANVEMANDVNGKESVYTRLNSWFDAHNVSIENSGVRRGRKFCAKAVCTGIVNPYSIFRLILNIKRMIVNDDSEVRLTLYTNSKENVFENVKISSVTLELASATMAAQIKIIPDIGNVYQGLFDIHKDAIKDYLNAETVKLTTFLSTLYNLKFDRPTYGAFKEILAIATYEEASLSISLDDIILNNFGTDETYAIIAKACITKNF